jgi:hypothetical protein
VDNGKYTRSVQVPQYLPSEKKPEVFELYNAQKYGKLIAEINNANISEEDKQFLKLAASRHIIFNYAKIADYYANSDKEVQKLMEKSALVIIDLDDAIANGYVQFSQLIKNIMNDTGEDTKGA